MAEKSCARHRPDAVIEGVTQGGETRMLGIEVDLGHYSRERIVGKLDAWRSYPDGGNSVELYWSDRVAELEPLSPEVILRPEQSYAFPEKWALYALPAAVTSFEQARELVGRIPPSPFKVEP